MRVDHGAIHAGESALDCRLSVPNPIQFFRRCFCPLDTLPQIVLSLLRVFEVTLQSKRKHCACNSLSNSAGAASRGQRSCCPRSGIHRALSSSYRFSSISKRSTKGGQITGSMSQLSVSPVQLAQLSTQLPAPTFNFPLHGTFQV